MRNIYIVDDDDAVRASLHALLSVQSNALIHSFRSGDAFLAANDELGPGVLLLDFHMPGASGIDVLKAVCSDGRKYVPVILTGQGNIGVAVQAMKAGATDFLEKPYGPAKLIETIEQAFSRFEQDNAAGQRAEAAKARLARLSGREADVLRGLIDGRPNKVIAQELSLSPRTVEIYRANLMDKLEVRSLSEALHLSFSAGLVPE